ncbi:LmbE-like protein [Hesseltinella vesiculosa]|uniref:N-acetylglucosaminylphosphatidylinositol deacetylase n=1 Tax=Hesseltinella vesiculosa TaxID=101127 RepID=A0A1X2GVZ6_9FUNG|nr:LmbE-like protein [Hesseltinella vesiculosa]
MIAFALSLLLVVSILMYSYAILAQQQHHSLPIESKNTLLLIAHPDDECMFFGPTLMSIRANSPKTKIHVVCLSTGDAVGLGDQRKKELKRSCHVFGIAPGHVRTFDHKDLRDGMKNRWPPKLIADLVKEVIDKYRIDTVITFDDFGVSGHLNHQAAYHGIQEYLRTHAYLQVYKLKSISLVRKYIGIVDVLFVKAQQLIVRPPTAPWISISSPPAYLQTHKAMRQHRTQLVWFRWLYVTFSRYMYINELEQVA